MGSMEMIMTSIDDVSSSFFLYEGSADSEDTIIHDHDIDETLIIFNDDDDAESCISQSPFDDTTGDYAAAVEDSPDEVGSSPLDQKWSDEDQDEVVSGRRRIRRRSYHENEDRKRLKATICLDSEVDKNRLFWEACLTSN